MVKQIELPDGKIGEFPDDMPDTEIQAILAKEYPPEAERPEIAGVPLPTQRENQFFREQLSNFTGFFADPVVDLAGSVLSAAGVEDTPRSVEDLARLAGDNVLPERGDQPRTLGERVARGVGETAGALVPFGATANLARKGTGVVAKVADQITKSAAKSPVATAGIDLLSGVSSGAAADVGFRVAPSLGLNPETGELIGAIIGGTGPVAALSAPRAAAATARATGRVVSKFPVGRAVTDIFGTESSRAKASARARGLVDDPEAAARRTVTGDRALSPAQRSEEPKLLALEREVLKRDPDLAADFSRRLDEIEANLEAEIRTQAGTGSIDDTRAFLNARRQRLVDAMDERTRQALVEADEALAKLSPKRQARESSTILRDKVERALLEIREEEKRIWGKVDKQIFAPTSEAKKVYNKHREGISRATAGDIPEDATTFLGGNSDQAFGDTEPVFEIMGLYSKLREVGRKAAASEDANTARIANEISEAILEDIRKVQSADLEFDTARQFSFDLNEKFSRGPVGRLLSRDQRGGKVVDPQLSLKRTVGKGGPEGFVEAEALQEATPSTAPEIEDFLRTRFPSKREGTEFDVDAARDFIENEEALQQFPRLRQQMTDAIDAREAADFRGTKGDNLRAALSGNKSKTSEFLGAPVGEEIKRVIRSNDPKSGARELKRQTRTNAKARDGLKTGTIEHVIDAARKGALDDEGTQPLLGRAMKAVLKDRKTMAVVNEILTKSEVNRLRQMADRLVKQEKLRGKTPDIGGLLGDQTSGLDVLSGVLGARVGTLVNRLTGGGNIQTPGIFARLFRQKAGFLSIDKAERMLVEAVKDNSGNAMAALLMPSKTVKQQRIITRRLNAWFAGPAGRAFTRAVEAAEGEEEQ